MLQKIREFLKKILPPPVRAFNREVERILLAVGRVFGKAEKLEEDIAAQRREAQEQSIRLENKFDALAAAFTEKADRALKAEADNAAAAERISESVAILCRQIAEHASAKDVKALFEQNAALSIRIEEQGREIALLKRLLAEQGEELKLQDNALTRQDEILAQQNEALERQEKLLSDFPSKAKEGFDAVSQQVQAVNIQAASAACRASEAVWAEVFNNAVSGSGWLLNKSFAPGRWAVGYPYLYAMYRVLNDGRPKRILELGLGQSTRMISQYTSAHEGVEHIVVEHDDSWIEFFKKDFSLSDRSRIIKLNWGSQPYKEADEVRIFDGFENAFAGQRFDFISIDAPLGGDMPRYARIDVLKLLPNCLAEDFVIMIDDAERVGEKNAIAEMESRLKEAGIAYSRGRFCGEKECVLLAAKSMKFLASV